MGVLASMTRARWLRRNGAELVATRLGEQQLGALGIDLASAQGERRVFARPCADLTQRQPHLGGALGTHMLKTLHRSELDRALAEVSSCQHHPKGKPDVS